MPHGRHMYAKVSDTTKATMCTYPHYDHEFHTGNVYCGAVLNVQKSIFPTKKKIKNSKKQHPQLGFTFITSLDVSLIMVEFQNP